MLRPSHTRVLPGSHFTNGETEVPKQVSEPELLPRLHRAATHHSCQAQGTHLNLSGVRKLRRWNSSSRLFWRGVPVSSSL